MREIKFRSWDDTLDNMFSWEKLSIDKDGIWVKIEQNSRLIDKTLILMQFTGLKDKNGVEIYEYDILKGLTGLSEEINGFVEYIEDWGRFVVNNNITLGKKLCDKLEVIGNIYENPELLKGEE